MFALLVNDGDTTSLKRVFSTREALDPFITCIVADCDYPPVNGFTTGEPVKDSSDHRKSYIHVFEESMEDWVLLFTIIELAVDMQLDIEV